MSNQSSLCLTRQALLNNAQNIKILVPALQQIQSHIIEHQKSQELIETEIEGIKVRIAALPKPETLTVDINSPELHDLNRLSNRSKILLSDISSLQQKIALLSHSLENNKQEVIARYSGMLNLRPDEIEQFFSHNLMSNSIHFLELNRSQLQSLQQILAQTQESYQRSILADQPLLLEQMLQEKKVALQAQKDALLLQWHQALKKKADINREATALQLLQQVDEKQYNDARRNHHAAVEIYANKQLQSHSKWARMSFALMNKQELERKKYIDGLKLNREKLLEEQGREELERLNMHKEDQKMHALIVSEQAEQERANEADNKSKKAKERRELRKKLEEEEKKKQAQTKMKADEDLKYLETQITQKEYEAIEFEVLENRIKEMFSDDDSCVFKTFEQLPLYQQKYKTFLLQKADWEKSREDYLKSLEKKSKTKRQELISKFDSEFMYESVYRSVQQVLCNYQENLEKSFFCKIDKAEDVLLATESLLQFDQSFKALKQIAKTVQSQGQELCWYVSADQYKMLKDSYNDLAGMYRQLIEEKINIKIEKSKTSSTALSKKIDSLVSLQQALESDTNLENRVKNEKNIKKCIDSIALMQSEKRIIDSQLKIYELSFERLKRYKATRYLFDLGSILNPAYLLPLSGPTYQNLPLKSQPEKELKAFADQLKELNDYKKSFVGQSSIPIEKCKKISINLVTIVGDILKMQGFTQSDCQYLSDAVVAKLSEMIDLYKAGCFNKDFLTFHIFEELKQDVLGQGKQFYSLEQLDNLTTIIVILIDLLSASTQR